MFDESQKTQAPLASISANYPTPWPVVVTRFSFASTGMVRRVPLPSTARNQSMLGNELQCSPIGDEEAGRLQNFRTAVEQQTPTGDGHIEVPVPTAPLWISLCVIVIVTGVRKLATHSLSEKGFSILCAARCQ